MPVNLTQIPLRGEIVATTWNSACPLTPNFRSLEWFDGHTCPVPMSGIRFGFRWKNSRCKRVVGVDGFDFDSVGIAESSAGAPTR